MNSQKPNPDAWIVNQAARNFVESRQPHQIRKSLEYTQKLAKDYVALFGAGQFEDVMRRKAAELRLVFWTWVSPSLNLQFPTRLDRDV